MTIPELCLQHVMSSSKWRAKFGSKGASLTKRHKELEEEQTAQKDVGLGTVSGKICKGALEGKP